MHNDIAQSMGGQGFDTQSVEPAQDFEVLPAGEYVVQVDKAEAKQNSNQTGYYLGLELTVLDPEQYSGRKLWHNINYNHTSEIAQRIGQQQLSALGIALGIGVIESSEQLLGQYAIAVVKAKKRKNTGELENEIRTYKPVQQNGRSQQAPQQPQQQAPAPPPRAPQQQAAPQNTGNVPPWKR